MLRHFCRSWRILKYEPLLAQLCFDTAVNELSDVEMLMILAILLWWAITGAWTVASMSTFSARYATAICVRDYFFCFTSRRLRWNLLLHSRRERHRKKRQTLVWFQQDSAAWKTYCKVRDQFSWMQRSEFSEMSQLIWGLFCHGGLQNKLSDRNH